MLDMVEPVTIWDLATNMIRLAGLEPGRDIEVREVGLRPGEKLDEDLHFEHEVCEPTAHPKITCVRGEGVEAMRLAAAVERLTDLAVRMDFAGIRRELRELVPEFTQGSETDPRPVQPSWDPWELIHASARDGEPHGLGTARPVPEAEFAPNV